MMIFVGDEVWAITTHGDYKLIPLKHVIYEIHKGEFLTLKTRENNFLINRTIHNVYFSEKEAYLSLNDFERQQLNSNSLYKKMKAKRNFERLNSSFFV